MPTPNEQAKQIRNRYTTKLTELRARPDLTETGRAQHISRLHAACSDELQKLRKAVHESGEQRKQEIIGKLARNPTAYDSASNQSYRSARAQAADLKTPAEAAALLAEAHITADGHLERAVALHALDKAMGATPDSDQWAAITNKWAERQAPSVGEALTELSEIRPLSVTEQLTYSLGGKPRECTQVNTAAITDVPEPPALASSSSPFDMYRRRE